MSGHRLARMRDAVRVSTATIVPEVTAMNRLMFAVCSSILVIGSLVIGCGDDPAKPPTGTIRVFVFDGGDASFPVADVEIRIESTNLMSRTDANGAAVFEVAVGDYFVEADVCCAGPGFIKYHEAASVTRGQQTEVVLTACLGCVCKPTMLP